MCGSAVHVFDADVPNLVLQLMVVRMRCKLAAGSSMVTFVYDVSCCSVFFGAGTWREKKVLTV